MQIASFSETNFEAGEVKIKVLAQNSHNKEIQILMAKNSQMKEHKAPYPISVQVLSGEIDFEVEGQIFRLKALDLISLEANVPHSLKAFEDSNIRLSLVFKDQATRIASVLKL